MKAYSGLHSNYLSNPTTSVTSWISWIFFCDIISVDIMFLIKKSKIFGQIINAFSFWCHCPPHQRKLSPQPINPSIWEFLFSQSYWPIFYIQVIVSISLVHWQWYFACYSKIDQQILMYVSYHNASTPTIYYSFFIIYDCICYLIYMISKITVIKAAIRNTTRKIFTGDPSINIIYSKFDGLNSVDIDVR